MQLDLVPLAKDRFWIEGLNEIGVVERNDRGQPITFLMKDDLIASALEAKNKGDAVGLDRLSMLLKEHFDYVVVDRKK